MTVNAVCPGFTDTDIVRRRGGQYRGQDRPQRRRGAGPAGRLSNPQQRLVETAEVASAVLWLCMPQSGAMNGQSLAVADGEVM
ncbi:SDR family oxidoreductase [Massilia sp. B-10]|nr:SDR family oxidoreductase [Massilia sp. B-10]